MVTTVRCISVWKKSNLSCIIIINQVKMVLIIFEKCIQRIVSSKNPTHKKTTAVNHSYTKRHLANNSLVIIIIIIIVLLLYSQFTLKCVVTKHLRWHHVIKSSSIKWTVDQLPSRLGSIPFADPSIFYNNMNTLSRCKQRPCCVILRSENLILFVSKSSDSTCFPVMTWFTAAVHCGIFVQ